MDDGKAPTLIIVDRHNAAEPAGVPEQFMGGPRHRSRTRESSVALPSEVSRSRLLRGAHPM